MLFWQGGGTSSHRGDGSGRNTAPKRCVTWQSVALRLQYGVIQWPTNVESEAFNFCKCFVVIYAWFVDLDNLHVCVRIVHRCTVIYCALLRRDVAALGSKLCSSRWNWFFLMGLGFDTICCWAVSGPWWEWEGQRLSMHMYAVKPRDSREIACISLWSPSPAIVSYHWQSLSQVYSQGGMLWKIILQRDSICKDVYANAEIQVTEKGQCLLAE